MCNERELVPIPDFLWPFIYEFDPDHCEYGVDTDGRKCLRLDKCIIQLVKRLWDCGFPTKSCCCGHDSSWGGVLIDIDGRDWVLQECSHKSFKFIAQIAEERDELVKKVKQLQDLVDKLKYSDNRPIYFDDKGAMDE